MSESLLFIVIPCIVIFAVIVTICVENKDKTNSKINVDNIVNIVAGNEKEIIEELFEDCINFTLTNISTIQDSGKAILSVVIFQYELIFHIVCLFYLNMQNDIEEFKKVHLVYTMLLFKKLQTYCSNVDYDYVNHLLITRIKQIQKENDFETRNFNFLNLCNYELQLADEYVKDEIEKNNKSAETMFSEIFNSCFVIDEDIDRLNISLGNPLNMSFLPLAYKSGLIDKYLEKLSNGRIKIGSKNE